MDPLAQRVAVRHLNASQSYAAHLAKAWLDFMWDVQPELERAMKHLGYTESMDQANGFIFWGHPSGHDVSMIMKALPTGNIGASWSIKGVPGDHHGALGSYSDPPAHIAATFVKHLSTIIGHVLNKA